MYRKLVLFFSVILILGLSVPTSAELVAHWRLDDGTGTTAKDSAGDFDGTLQGGSLWVQGVIGGGLWFDGTGDCVLIGSDPTFNPTGSFSIALWANIEDWTTEWGCSPVGIRGDGVGWCLRRFGGWWSSQYPDTYTMPTNVLCFTTRGIGHVGDDVEDTPSTSVPPLNEWIHITCIYDSENNKKFIYFDGEVDAEWDTNVETLTPATQSLYIGAISNAANTGPEQFFGGMLDDVRFYSHALIYEEVQSAMAGISPGVASTPYPIDEATDVSRDVILSWKAGQFADKHNVYLGTSFEDVNNADSSSPLLIGPELDVNSFSPGRLEFDQSYFWRVDEVNAPPDLTVFKSDIWSFTVEPVAYPIPYQSITATASSYFEDEISQSPRNTINNSGMTDDLHSKNVDHMWLTAPGAEGPGWIQYEFDKLYKLHEMLVWNYNGPPFLNWYGIREVTVEYSTNGTDWTAIEGVTEFAQAPGKDNYAANTIIPFNGLAVKYVRITATSNWSNGVFTDYGLSEVRFLYVPVSAKEPDPIDGTINVPVNVTLGWRAGREASEHNVYISTDEQSVSDGTAPVNTVSQAEYGPLSLDLSNTYYWRVDEVNNIDIWPSDIWSLSTQDYLVLDDFESYNDISETEEGSNLVYLTWTDGYDNPSVNGSIIGYVTGNSLEKTLVHGGEQSVPVTYDNSQASLSEVTVNPADLAIGSDWTVGSPETLVLWFFGDPNNATTEQMYMKINGVSIVYPNSKDLAIRRWNQWNINLASLGINMGNVSTFTIGFERTGATGGTGTVLFDDIRLYRFAPPIPEPVDPGNDGLVAYYAMENNVQDGSSKGLNGTVIGSPTYVSGKTGYGVAIQLNGTDQTVDLGNKAEFNPAGSLSISLWANIGAWSTAWEHVMVGNRGEGSVGWQVRRHSSSSLCFTTRGVGNDDTASKIEPPLNEWIHIACVYDNVNNTKRIYINGLEDTIVDTDPGSINVTTHNTYIGARANSGNTGQEAFFTGMLDEVRIYDRALSDGEILFIADQLL